MSLEARGPLPRRKGRPSPLAPAVSAIPCDWNSASGPRKDTFFCENSMPRSQFSAMTPRANCRVPGEPRALAALTFLGVTHVAYRPVCPAISPRPCPDPMLLKSVLQDCSPDAFLVDPALPIPRRSTPPP